MPSRVRLGTRKCENTTYVCNPQSQRLNGTTFASNTFVININSKGNNDLITHNLNYQIRIIGFIDELDNGRQKNDFYANTILSNSFVLKNDFTNNKFSGKLIVVKI